MLKPAATVVAALAVVALGVLGARSLAGTDLPAPDVTTEARRRPPDFGATPAAQAELRRRLELGVDRAAALGAQVQAGAWIAGRPEPVFAGVDLDRRMRLWSMSKPFAAIVALRTIRPWPDWLKPALEDMILRSENCPMRELMVELQRRDGSVEAARHALAELFRAGGGEGTAIASEVEPPDPDCRRRLERDGISSPDAGALLMGTSTWTVDDAVHMIHALASGRFDAEGEQLLALMRQPKAASEEIADPGEYTADSAWGAGRALDGLDPAYKPGWGGTPQGEFMVGQLVVVPTTSPTIAIAVMVHPHVQPAVDDPGRTIGPQAVEMVLRSIRPLIPRLGQPATLHTMGSRASRAG